MEAGARLIIQVASGSAVGVQLSARPPEQVLAGDVVVEEAPADALGDLEAPDAGEVVLTVPSPETLRREPDLVRRVLVEAGTGIEPLVVVVEAAEELRDDELAELVQAAEHAPRPVILRVIRDA